MKLEITLKRSLIGRRPNQVKTAHALGLDKLGKVVIQEKTDSILGMIKVVNHLVEVKEYKED